MNTDQLIETLHKGNDQHIAKLNQTIQKINDDWTMAIKIVALCAQGPHLVERRTVSQVSTGTVTHMDCHPSCPTCLAKRYLSNSLTEEDMKLVKGEK